MKRFARVALVVFVALLALPAASATATPRMPIGFFDDPSFRWAAAPTPNLSSAQKAHASIIHVLADWSQIAPTKPASPLNGDDPAYKLSDLDAIVRAAPKYNLQVLMTITGTPKWANGGKTPNNPPTNMANLTQFAHMLAARYNGLRAGFGAVSRWSIWNEPNLELFLTPQFRGDKIVSPATYAKLFMAGYKGIKAGNPLAVVAAGETSNRGRNKPSPKGDVQGDSVAPATFARLVAEANPKLPFSAWATHPYPTETRLGPNQTVAYPNVTMTRVEQFGKSLQEWFHRRVPIWVTEYGEQTRPEYILGVSRTQQAADARQVLELAKASPYVEMFIWFILRDSTNKTWFSGLLAKNGTKKPSYTPFATAAKGIDGQTQSVKPGKFPTVKLDIPFLAYGDVPGAPIGVTYSVFDGKKEIYVGQARSKTAPDQTVSFVAKFKPGKATSYTIAVEAGDRHGQITKRTVWLVAS